MSRRIIHVSVLVLLTGPVACLRAETAFDLVPTFDAEPLVYAVTNVVVSASSTHEGASATAVIDGSGLTDDLVHGTEEATMWLSDRSGPQPAWIQFEFDDIYEIEEMWVWNYNAVFRSALGVRDALIEHSLDGNEWTLLGRARFPRAPASAGYEHDAVVDFNGVAARYVRLTPTSNWGGPAMQHGLSEVRFFYTSIRASGPIPAAGETDVDPEPLLQWRPGREAVSHRVYFSDDRQTVTDGNAPVSTTTQSDFEPGPLLLAHTYYWRVDEVNEAADPNFRQGPVWSFVTSPFVVMDDFEGYTDDGDNRIYQIWADGWEFPANGSVVGYMGPPYAEQNVVHGGRQSMPMAFDNTEAAYSEAKRVFRMLQDWTVHGATHLSLYFYGPAENTAGQLYVKINGVKATYSGAADDLKTAQWTQWSVDLAPLGLDLTAVETLCVGIEGENAVGTLFVDDIRLER